MRQGTPVHRVCAVLGLMGALATISLTVPSVLIIGMVIERDVELGLDPLEVVVHDLTPGPEAVSHRTARFTKTSESALKCVAVSIREAGDDDIRRAGRKLCTGLNSGDHAGIDTDFHIVSPAVGKQGFAGVYLAHETNQIKLYIQLRPC